MAASPGSPPPTLRSRTARGVAYRHPVNRAYQEEAPLGARVADAVTGFMGSWKFIVLQTVIVTLWIGGNILLLFNFDPAPFILLNLAFSTQAAYAAPLILLAQTRQADRDKVHEEANARHRDYVARRQRELLKENTELTEKVKELTEQVAELTRSIHAHVVRAEGS